MYQALVRFYERVALASRILSWAGLAGLVLISFAIMADVAMRVFFNHPIHGMEDFVDLFIPIVIVSCFPAGMALKTNITIRFLGAAVGRRGGAWLELFGQLALLLFMVVLAWMVIEHTGTLGNRRTFIVQLPLQPTWYVVCLLVVLAAGVQALVALVHLIAALIGATVPMLERAELPEEESDPPADPANPPVAKAEF